MAVNLHDATGTQQGMVQFNPMSLFGRTESSDEWNQTQLNDEQLWLRVKDIIHNKFREMHMSELAKFYGCNRIEPMLMNRSEVLSAADQLFELLETGGVYVTSNNLPKSGKTGDYMKWIFETLEKPLCTGSDIGFKSRVQGHEGGECSLLYKEICEFVIHMLSPRSDKPPIQGITPDYRVYLQFFDDWQRRPVGSGTHGDYKVFLAKLYENAARKNIGGLQCFVAWAPFGRFFQSKEDVEKASKCVNEMFSLTRKSPSDPDSTPRLRDSVFWSHTKDWLNEIGYKPLWNGTAATYRDLAKLFIALHQAPYAGCSITQENFHTFEALMTRPSRQSLTPSPAAPPHEPA